MHTLPPSLVRAAGAFLGLATLVLAAPGLSAQTTFGVRGGVTVAGVSGDLGDTFDESNRNGFVGGVFLDFGASGLVGFQLGAQYMQKGAEFDAGAAVQDLSLDYLEIPAVVKLGIPVTAVKPSVFAGVGLGFNTGCESGGESCDDDVTSTDFSGIIGADVALDLGGLSLFADGRYYVGLSDIADSGSFQELKNRVWTLQAGLGFPLGG